MEPLTNRIDPAYVARIGRILGELGIPADYGSGRLLELQPEETDLETARVLTDGRHLRLSRTTVEIATDPTFANKVLRARIAATLRKSVTHGQQLLDRERVLKARWDSMRTNALPGAMSAAEGRVLKAFDDWSQTSRVSVNSVKPQWKHPDDDYLTLDCRVDATGNLAAITRFIYEVERDPLALKVDGIELTAREGEGGQLSLALQVSGLFLNVTSP